MSTLAKREVTVESALKELREMFPASYRRIELVEVEGPQGRTEDSFALINVYEDPQRPLNGFVHEYAPTLREAMAQVREWKAKQSS